MYDIVKIFASIAFSSFMLFTICFFARKIRVEHPNYVFTLMYTFSLGVITSLMFLFWAHSSGAVDAQGAYVGNLGQAAKYIVEFFTNIGQEINLIAFLFMLLVLPQALAYLLSGLFGCAANIILFRFGGTIAVWSIAKCFAFAAGYIIVEGPFGLMFGWKNFSLNTFELTIPLATSMMGLTMVMVNVYVELNDVVVTVYRRNNGYFQKLHAWATRFYQ